MAEHVSLLLKAIILHQNSSVVVVNCGCGQLWSNLVVVNMSPCSNWRSKGTTWIPPQGGACHNVTMSQCHNVTMSQHVQQLKVQPIQCNETMMLNAIDLKRVVDDQNKSLNMHTVRSNIVYCKWSWNAQLHMITFLNNTAAVSAVLNASTSF